MINATALAPYARRAVVPAARYVIYVVLDNGQHVEAFRWTRDEQTGCQKAMREAREFGLHPVEAYALDLNDPLDRALMGDDSGL